MYEGTARRRRGNRIAGRSQRPSDAASQRPAVAAPRSASRSGRVAVARARDRSLRAASAATPARAAQGLRRRRQAARRAVARTPGSATARSAWATAAATSRRSTGSSRRSSYGSRRSSKEFDCPTEDSVRRFQRRHRPPRRRRRRRSDPQEDRPARCRKSVATWYGPGFFGNRTACGVRLRRADDRRRPRDPSLRDQGDAQLRRPLRPGTR